MQESVAERIGASDLEYETDESASWRLESEGRTCGRKKYETDESVAKRIGASDLEYVIDESAERA